MTAPLVNLWKPGEPLPRRANRATIRLILQHELGVCVGPRFADRLDVAVERIAGQSIWPVDATLRAARSGRKRRYGEALTGGGELGRGERQE
jgi:hypothetical protein